MICAVPAFAMSQQRTRVAAAVLAPSQICDYHRKNGEYRNAIHCQDTGLLDALRKLDSLMKLRVVLIWLRCPDNTLLSRNFYIEDMGRLEGFVCRVLCKSKIDSRNALISTVALVQTFHNIFTQVAAYHRYDV